MTAVKAPLTKLSFGWLLSPVELSLGVLRDGNSIIFASHVPWVGRWAVAHVLSQNQNLATSRAVKSIAWIIARMRHAIE